MAGRMDAGGVGIPIDSVATLEEIQDLSGRIQGLLVCGLDDPKARALGRLANLKVLLQDGSPSITDAGLAALSTLRCLEALDLRLANAISDVGLEWLGTLQSLRWLNLEGCSGVTVAGVSQLRGDRPNCEVVGWP